MAQAPQPPHKPAPPQQHQAPKPGDKPPAPKPGDKNDKLHQQGEFKEGHAPLRDPAEGKPPAVGGGHLTDPRDPRVDERDRTFRPGDPQPIGVSGLLIEDGERDPGTVAEEQRIRSAEIEAMGVEAYKDSIDERSEEEKSEHPTVLPPPQRYGSDDEPLPEGQRRVEHHVEGSRK